MKIKYYTGVADKPAAEVKCAKVMRALRESRLPFKCGISAGYGSYSVTIELTLDVFNSWSDMEEYVRNFVVSYNKNKHITQDIKRLEATLEGLS